MASLQTLHLAHLPPDLAIHVALYKDLQNASFLRDQLLQGNPDFEYALIDASVIISTTHVLAAVFRAANDWLNGRLKSRNVHSEIVFSLGANNNISHSLQTFGLTPTTTTLLAIKVSMPPTTITASTVSAHLSAAVQGTPVDFDDANIVGVTDVARVRKVYKLNAVGDGGSKGKRWRKDGSEEASGGVEEGVVVQDGDGKGEREKRELEVAVLGLIALRGAV